MSLQKPPDDFPDNENPLGETQPDMKWPSPAPAREESDRAEYDLYESERKTEEPSEGVRGGRPWFLSAGRPAGMADVMRLMNPDPLEESHEEGEAKRRTWAEDEIRDEEEEELEGDVEYQIPADDLEPEEELDETPGWEDCLEKALEAMKQVWEAYPGLPERACPLQTRPLTSEERNRELFSLGQGERPETALTPEEMLRRQALPMDARFWNVQAMAQSRKKAAENLPGDSRGEGDPDGVLMYLPVGPVIGPKEEFLKMWWQWVWTHVVEPQPCDVPLVELLTAWRERLNTENAPDRYNEWMYRELSRSVTGYGSSIDEFPDLLAELEKEDDPFGYE